MLLLPVLHIFVKVNIFEMLLSIDVNKLLSGILAQNNLSMKEVVCDTMTLSKSVICRVTGMSCQELDHFLDQKGISHFGNRIDYEALQDLKEWYLKKMQRYVRNALAHKVVSGIEEDLLFYEFCEQYHSYGHPDVNSWDDIDEYRLLQDFEEECLETCSVFVYTDNHNGSLLSRIRRSFLFHLRLKRATKHNVCLSGSSLLFTLSSRYYIFTDEADSNALSPFIKALLPVIQRLNPPRRNAPYVLAS